MFVEVFGVGGPFGLVTIQLAGLYGHQHATDWGYINFVRCVGVVGAFLAIFHVASVFGVPRHFTLSMRVVQRCAIFE